MQTQTQGLCMVTQAMLSLPHACLDVHLRKGAGSCKSAMALPQRCTMHLPTHSFAELFTAAGAVGDGSAGKEQAAGTQGGGQQHHGCSR